MTRWRPWIPVTLWAIFVSTMSSDRFSSNNTSRVIVPVLQWLFPHASMDTIELLHHLIRKSAHVFEYFGFGMLLFRAIRGDNRGWTLRWAALTVVLSAVFASLDEFHQMFVPSRGPSPWDALARHHRCVPGGVRRMVTRKAEPDTSRSAEVRL